MSRLLLSSIACLCLLFTACMPSIEIANEPADNSQSLTSTPSALPLEPPKNLQEYVKNQSVILYTKQESGEPFPLLSYPELSTLNQPEFSTIYGDQIGYQYANDFSPQLAANGQYLMMPGTKWQRTGTATSEDASTWLANFNTGNVQELEPRTNFAVWSPDGGQLAFIKNETLYLNPVNTNAAGESVSVFTKPGLGEFFLAWSPDGQQIAVVSTDVGESIAGSYPLITDTLWTVSVNGTEPQEVGTFSTVPIEHSRHELQWSPDGSVLLIGMSQPNQVLALNGDQTMLEEGMKALSWVPQQSRLLVQKGNGSLSIMDPYTQEIVTEINNDRAVTAWAFSENGRFLAYSTERDGEDSVKIMRFDLAQEKGEMVGAVKAQIVSSLHWTPTNDTLILDDGDHQTPIWIMDTKLNSKPEVLIDKGLLINVIHRPTTYSN